MAFLKGLEGKSSIISMKKAKAYPAKYLSVIIDGMDQKSTSIPHFVREVKS